MIQPWGTVNVCVKFHSNPCHSCRDISVWTKVVDRPPLKWTRLAQKERTVLRRKRRSCYWLFFGEQDVNCSSTTVLSLHRRSGVFLLSMHRAGSEDLRGPCRSGLQGDQHLGGPAESPRRANRLPVAAWLWPRTLRSDWARRHRDNSSHLCSKPGLHHHEDHHPAQRYTRSHRVPDLRYQTKKLKLRTNSALFSPAVNGTRFIICTPVYFLCTLIRLW